MKKQLKEEKKVEAEAQAKKNAASAQVPVQPSQPITNTKPPGGSPVRVGRFEVSEEDDEDDKKEKK